MLVHFINTLKSQQAKLHSHAYLPTALHTHQEPGTWAVLFWLLPVYLEPVLLCSGCRQSPTWFPVVPCLVFGSYAVTVLRPQAFYNRDLEDRSK